MPIDWTRVSLTEHTTEAAALVGECQAVIDFGSERVQYEIKVYESIKGGSGLRYFAIGTNREDADGFRPFADGASPEEALEACLANAGIHHRRRVKQAGE